MSERVDLSVKRFCSHRGQLRSTNVVDDEMNRRGHTLEADDYFVSAELS